jgi:hypothetical protein
MRGRRIILFRVRVDETDDVLHDFGVDVFVAVFEFQIEGGRLDEFREGHRLVGDHRCVEELGA